MVVLGGRWGTRALRRASHGRGGRCGGVVRDIVVAAGIRGGFLFGCYAFIARRHLTWFFVLYLGIEKRMSDQIGQRRGFNLLSASSVSLYFTQLDMKSCFLFFSSSCKSPRSLLFRVSCSPSGFHPLRCIPSIVYITDTHTFM